jgi:hypothetical protein
MESIEEDIKKLKEILEDYSYKSLGEEKTLDSFLDDFDNLSKFKNSKTLLGDCITTSFHVLEYITNDLKLQTSYILGKFYVETKDKTNWQEVLHVIPCVVHKSSVNNLDYTTSFCSTYT